MTTNESIPMTDLDAVNLMLAAIGSVIVPSLQVTDTNADAESALKLLSDTSREVQSAGWHFNTEIDFPLLPNDAGEVVLPQNTLMVREIRAGRYDRDLVERGGKLYDRRGHTFQIGEKVLVDIVLALPYDQLPQAGKWYVAVKAARRFAVGKIPSEATFRFTKSDEDAALVKLEQADAETVRDTQGTVNQHVNRMRRR
jgi:hypothetical protein